MINVISTALPNHISVESQEDLNEFINFIANKKLAILRNSNLNITGLTQLNIHYDFKINTAEISLIH